MFNPNISAFLCLIIPTVYSCSLDAEKVHRRTQSIDKKPVSADSYETSSVSSDSKNATVRKDDLKPETDSAGSNATAEEGSALVMHRCGANYQATFKGTKNAEDAWTTRDSNQVETNRKIAINYTSTIESSGTIRDAKLIVATVLNSLQQVNSNRSQQAILNEIQEWDGTYQYTFYEGAELTALRARSPDWSSVECGILPVKSMIRDQTSGAKLTVSSERAFPSLVSPNASTEVYDAYIGDQRVFANIDINSTLTTPGKPDQSAHMIVDMKVSRQKKSNSNYTVLIETIAKQLTSQSNISDLSSAQAKRYLLKWGLHPRLEYNIDTRKRLTRSITVETHQLIRSTDRVDTLTLDRQ